LVCLKFNLFVSSILSDALNAKKLHKQFLMPALAHFEYEMLAAMHVWT